MPPSTSSTAWYSFLYDNHYLHGSAPKRPEAYDNSMKYRRVYCKSCYKHRFDATIQAELQAHAVGELTVLRTDNEIRNYLWETPASKSQPGVPHILDGYLNGRPENMLSHLQHCPFQPQNVIERARTDYINHKTGTSSRKSAPAQSLDISGLASSSSIPNFIAQLPPPVSRRTSQDLSMRPSSPSNSAIAFNEATSSQGPSESASVVSSRAHSSLSRHGSRTSGHGDTQTLLAQSLWTRENQSSFERNLIHLIAEGNLPLRFSENRSWLLFCQSFIPNAKVPTRKVITNRILPQEVDYWRSRAYKQLDRQLVTLQSDGWTGLNNRHYIAFIATTILQVLPIRVYDVSADRKTAENLLALTEEVIKILSGMRATVVAWTTDASGESRKARRLMSEKQPDICVPDCYAHQINLIVGDYFKAKDPILLQTQDLATELITWLRSKTFILALLRNIQISSGSTPLAIIRAIITRWTAHYLAYRRLTEVHPALLTLVSNSANVDKIKTGDSKSRLKAVSMINLIFNEQFWNSLRQVVRHLEPLAVAVNILQSSHCRPDQVLTTFGLLYHQYSQLLDPSEQTVKRALLTSIANRWEKADQQIFIAAVILNPLLRLQPFAAIPHLSISGIYGILGQLWKRFYSHPAPSDLLKQLQDYLNNQGAFVFFPSFINASQEQAEEKGIEPNIAELWKGVIIPGNPNPGLVTLAQRIFSICPNSASCERLFSSFGNILTKSRSRLSNKALVELAELRLHLREEEFQSRSTKERVKRHFNLIKQDDQELVEDNGGGSTNTHATWGRLAGENESVDATSSDIPAFNQIISSFGLLEDFHDLPLDPSLLGKIPLNILLDFSKPFWADVLDNGKKGLMEDVEVSEMASAQNESDAVNFDDICLL